MSTNRETESPSNKIKKAAQKLGKIEKASGEIWQERKEVGDLLIEAHNECDHGEWMKYLRKHFPKGYDTAKRYMGVARHWERIWELVKDDPSIGLVEAIKRAEGKHNAGKRSSSEVGKMAWAKSANTKLLQYFQNELRSMGEAEHIAFAYLGDQFLKDSFDLLQEFGTVLHEVCERLEGIRKRLESDLKKVDDECRTRIHDADDLDVERDQLLQSAGTESRECLDKHFATSDVPNDLEDKFREMLAVRFPTLLEPELTECCS